MILILHCPKCNKNNILHLSWLKIIDYALTRRFFPRYFEAVAKVKCNGCEHTLYPDMRGSVLIDEGTYRFIEEKTFTDIIKCKLWTEEEKLNK